MNARIRVAHLWFAVVLAVSLISLGQIPARGVSTFIVTTRSDLPDVDATDGVCDVGNGTCSLRAAIQAANEMAGGDVISFAIGAGVKTIPIGSVLPIIEDQLMIDGTTQPGFAGEPLIVVLGLGVATGLDIRADDSSIAGLVVTGFGTGVRLAGDGDALTGSVVSSAAADGSDGVGVRVAGTGDVVGGTSGTTPGSGCAGDCNRFQGNGVAVSIAGVSASVRGNFFGVDDSGFAATGPVNGIGVQVEAASASIGGGTGASRNMFANNDVGLLLAAGSDGARVRRDYFGVDTSGENGLPGSGPAISIIGGTDLVIGGSITEGNVISGSAAGISIDVPLVAGVPADIATEISGNEIGTNAEGDAAIPNIGDGISSESVAGLTIGGSSPGDANVISGNLGSGISIRGTGQPLSTIEGNVIGTDATGTGALPNGEWGVDASFAAIGPYPSSLPGTSCVAPCNLVSGNVAGGIRLAGGGAASGNYVGTDVTGSTAIPNGGFGVDVDHAWVAYDVVSGNEVGGVFERSSSIVFGSYIGTDDLGTSALGNGDGSANAGGVVIGSGSGSVSFADVGYPVPSGPGNVISGNDGPGIRIRGSIANPTYGVRVNGNFVGVDATGDQPIPNASEGVVVQDGTQGIDVGPQLGVDPPNVISGNLGAGVRIAGSASARVRNNVIGSGSDPSVPIGNGGDGVRISASDQLVEGNSIRNNGGGGIVVVSGKRVQISENSISDNAGLGIDLGDDGVTPNDPGDLDVGPNDLLNHPTISSVETWGDRSLIRYEIDAPWTGSTVEFFRVGSCDPSGSGEGDSFVVGAGTFVDGTGVLTLGEPFDAGTTFTASLTGIQGSGYATSEFSPCVQSTVHPEDVTAPTSAIVFPQDGASYTSGLISPMRFTCDDGDGVGVGLCLAGTFESGQPLVMSDGGTYDFTVRSDDWFGNESTNTISYVVVKGSITETLTGAGTVDTDPSGIGANEFVPVQTSVSTTSAGTVDIQAGQVTEPSPPDWRFDWREVHISAPASSDASNPLQAKFRLDAPLWSGDPADVRLALNGSIVPICTTPGAAAPDPCSSTGVRLDDGDISLTAFATDLDGVWNLAWMVPPFAFSGFLEPIDGAPTVNVADAGTTIPFRFSLGRDAGLNIFADGSPAVAVTGCWPSAPRDPIERTMSAGTLPLRYFPKKDVYVYAFHTKRSWAGSCRTLSMTLIDGSSHHARLHFR
jgi:CSLREA domain-containing protein